MSEKRPGGALYVVQSAGGRYLRFGGSFGTREQALVYSNRSVAQRDADAAGGCAVVSAFAAPLTPPRDKVRATR